ncbi:MAG: ATPase, T2SS/T4P/T4SS family [Planctomycetota bacterium]
MSSTTVDASPSPSPLVDDATADAAAAAVPADVFAGSLSADQASVGLPSAAFLDLVPISFARRHAVLGLADPAAELVTQDAGSTRHRGPMRVACVDPIRAAEPIDAIGRLMGRSVVPVASDPAVLGRAINGAYQARGSRVSDLMASGEGSGDQEHRVDAAAGGLPGLVAAGPDQGDLLDATGKAPTIKLVDAILFEAVQQQASDVHLQPTEDRLVVRLRVDGVLFDHATLPCELTGELTSRVKVLAKMNIAEKRLAQDGRATVRVGDRSIDLRVSSVPTTFGEQVVIRLLDKGARLYTLPELGMGSRTLEGFRDLIGVEHGLMLVTGPTGSGKSTTLYAALQEVATRQRNVITLEDPVEYQLEGVSQIQVNRTKGMTFASGLRSVLRQDPDIIMVGEIRDHETAVLAIQAALTGHMVYSTLHTNDAASAVTRLLDLGIEPFLLSSSLVGVLAQRLVRRVCPACAAGVPAEDAASSIARIGVDAAAQEIDLAGMRVGPGCGQHRLDADKNDAPRETAQAPGCRGTGYRGRLGLFELLTLDESLRGLIHDRATASRLKAAAVSRGMTTLRDAGVDRVLAGQTTVDEVARVTARSEA